MKAEKVSHLFLFTNIPALVSFICFDDRTHLAIVLCNMNFGSMILLFRGPPYRATPALSQRDSRILWNKRYANEFQFLPIEALIDSF